MKIGMFTQKELEVSKRIRRELFALVRRMHVVHPEPSTDGLILQTMLNFCVTILADNNVSREKAVEEFDRNLRLARGELYDE